MTYHDQGSFNRYENASALARASDSPEKVCRLIFALGGDEAGVMDLRGSTDRGPAPRDDGGEPDIRLQRHAIVWVARHYTGATFEQIARAMNKDHSVIVRSHTKGRTLIISSRAFRKLCSTLESVIAPREVRLVHNRQRNMLAR